MRLTMQLIYDNLKADGGTLHLHMEESSWLQIVRYVPGEEMEDEFLLFGASDTFLDTMTGRGIICLGKPSNQLLEQNEVLYWENVADEQSLFMDIQRIFLKFNRWGDALWRAVRGNQSLEQIFWLATDVFENSMFIHDINFVQLASVNNMPGELGWDYDETNHVYTLPLEIMNDFKVNPDYIATMAARRPSIYPESNMGYQILYQNLWQQNQYRGRICINELGRKIRPSDFYLLEFFSEVVLEYLKTRELSSFIPLLSLSHFVIRLIEEERIDQMTIDQTLMRYGWTAGDQYICVCFALEETGAQNYSIQYQCSRLENIFADSCVFQYEKYIVMVLNLTFSDITVPVLKSRLSVPLREGLMKAGISTVCTDLSQFKWYYRQAIYAFETGNRKDVTFWCYSFDDYQTDFILLNALSRLPSRLLCSPEILLLKEYDKEHPSNLAGTLQCYLENDRNLARTSEILDIHRSTLLYRMGRIEAVTELKLEDPRVRFRLLLSYHLLEMGREELK